MMPAQIETDTNPDEKAEQNAPIVIPDAVFDWVSELVTDINVQVAAEVQKIEAERRPKLERILSVIRDSLRKELNHEVRTEMEIRFKKSMELSQQQFREKLQQVAAESSKDRLALEAELQSIRRHGEALSAELVCKETELGFMDREAEAMVDDPDVEISAMIRHNALRNELRSYIKGLRFLTGAPPEEK